MRSLYEYRLHYAVEQYILEVVADILQNKEKFRAACRLRVDVLRTEAKNIQ